MNYEVWVWYRQIPHTRKYWYFVLGFSSREWALETQQRIEYVDGYPARIIETMIESYRSQRMK